MNQQSLYRAKAPHLPLPVFHQPWWLDAVCGKDNWHAAMVLGKSGELLGLCTYFVRRKWGLSVIVNPPFTPYLGVWLNPEFVPKKQVSKYNHEIQILKALAEQLPTVAWYSLVHPPAFDNWLPFYWKGYRCSPRYTYLFEAAKLDDIYSNLASAVRNKIKLAQSNLVVEKSTDLNKFMLVYENTLLRNRFYSNIETKKFQDLSDTIFRNNSGEILMAIDRDAQPVAGVFLLSDTQTVYLWQMGYRKMAPSNKGAVQLLIYKAIQLAMETGRAFNFEGSMLPHIEPVFRAFGGRRVPVYHIFKASNRLIYALKELLGV